MLLRHPGETEQLDYNTHEYYQGTVNGFNSYLFFYRYFTRIISDVGTNATVQVTGQVLQQLGFYCHDQPLWIQRMPCSSAEVQMSQVFQNQLKSLQLEKCLNFRGYGTMKRTILHAQGLVMKLTLQLVEHHATESPFLILNLQSQKTFCTVFTPLPYEKFSIQRKLTFNTNWLPNAIFAYRPILNLKQKSIYL